MNSSDSDETVVAGSLEEPHGPDARASRDVGVLDVLTTLLRYRHVVVGLTLGFGIGAVVIGVIRPRTYSAEASFVPNSPTSNLGQLSGLAGQLGLTLPGTEPDQSPEFYVSLIRSAFLLRQLVVHPYSVEVDDTVVTERLVEWLGVGRGEEAVRIDEAVSDLRDLIRVTSDRRTGVVTLTIRTRHAELSQVVAAQALALVNAFNLESRQSSARQERVFIEARVMETGEDLREAEDRVEAFLEGNRQYSSSPQLSFEYDRLRREVRMIQQVYTSLNQAYQQASIDEVRTAPVITIIERPVRPARPDPRGLILIGLGGFMVGGVAAIVVALWVEFVRRSRDRDPELVKEYIRLRHEASQELRRISFPLFRRGRD